jgi:hypothetical protein
VGDIDHVALVECANRRRIAKLRHHLTQMRLKHLVDLGRVVEPGTQRHDLGAQVEAFVCLPDIAERHQRDQAAARGRWRISHLSRDLAQCHFRTGGIEAFENCQSLCQGLDEFGGLGRLASPDFASRRLGGFCRAIINHG